MNYFIYVVFYEFVLSYVLLCCDDLIYLYYRNHYFSYGLLENLVIAM